MSSGLVVHLENVPASPSRKSTTAHDGCWLHDFREIYRELGIESVEVLPDVIENQSVYVVTKPGSRLRTGVALSQQASEHARLASENERLKVELARARHAQEQLEAKVSSLEDLENSTAFRLVDRARRLPLGKGLVRSVGSTIKKVRRRAPSPSRKRPTLRI